MGMRFVTGEDAAALLRIYAQYIDTPITFECRLPTVEEFAGRVASICAGYPYLVWEEQEKIVGYAYAHRQKEREAYQWNAELSVYLDGDFTSRGIGKALYDALIKILRLQGIKTVYGIVTLPNEKSEQLHERMGFHIAGTCRCTGYKCGAWHDVRWFEKQIAPYEENPAPVCPVSELPEGRLLEILGGARL